VPLGTELDRYEGRAFVSLVGFRFLHTRLLGCRVPFHQHFDEVNLRLYVSREVGGELRRGVSFIREIVPKRAIATIARAVYNEPYVAFPMRSAVPSRLDMTPRVKYAWRSTAGWHYLSLTAEGEGSIPDPDAEAAFLSEHYWGYTRQRDGRTAEYRVVHPSWRVWAAGMTETGGNMVALFGATLARCL
jgi:uncharacterized protein YqjF (DUF2071 family)